MACNGLKKGSFHLFVQPNGRGSFLEKHVFGPIVDHFWSQSNPFSRHCVTLEGPKSLAMGSKWAHFTYLGTTNALGIYFFGKTHFGSLFDPF